ncbi:hypothetical protein ACFXKG_30745 [Streptomyces sp. NPDC059255]|uniref:hypothetical protein n=1 Tax=Streptomyces sp. NPDC059255 TaxID=3346793 RepID=UPI0036A5D23C
MNTEHTPVGQEVGPRPLAIRQPTPQHYPAPLETQALTLYQVPVPGAVEVQLPDGRTAWARPVDTHLDPLPTDATARREPMPGWAKAVGLVAGSITAAALGGALALRIAAPALGGLVDLLDILWKVALTLAVILLGAFTVARSLLAKAAAHSDTTPTKPPVVFAPQINTAGTRLIGRGGDVNIQWGDNNRNKQ